MPKTLAGIGPRIKPKIKYIVQECNHLSTVNWQAIMEKTHAKTIPVFEFFKLFPDEASAVKFVEEQVWPDGVKCRFCGSDKTSPRPHRHGHRCKSCSKDFTVRHGTIFEQSRLLLVKWLYAIYLMQTSRKSISSLQLSREMDVTQKTAWFLLYRIREACKQSDWMLTGVVEVDETCIGGKERNKHDNKKLRSGREPAGRQVVIGAREQGGNVKAKAISNTDAETLKGFIHRNVEPGSTVFTDDHIGCHGLHGVICNHASVKHSAKEYVNGMIHTNGIESVWALLKRGYTGTFHHFSLKHLQRYVDEFTFRLNEGNCSRDTIDRIKSVCVGSADNRLTCKDLAS